LSAGETIVATCNQGACMTTLKKDPPPPPAYQWFTTCGDVICRPPPADAGVSGTCPAEGSPCSTLGDTCSSAMYTCGVHLVCAAQDPKLGGCPISSKNFKNDVSYLGEGELQALHDEALGLKLATYHYKPQFSDPNPTHLGFIIEDAPTSAAVEQGKNRIDLYGYLSMVVATMQVQEKEIESLRGELARVRAGTARSECRGDKTSK
jgi:hypothetical protein